MMRRIWQSLMFMLMLWLAGICAAAAEGVVITVVGPEGTTEITTKSGVNASYTIKKGGEYTFTSSDPSTEVPFNIRVDAEGEDVTITLNGLNIHPDGKSDDHAAIGLGSANSVSILLAENTVNRLKGAGTSAIYINNNCQRVTIDGSGELYAIGSSSYRFTGYNHTSNYGAGIYKGNGDNELIINGGTIHATGAMLAAGIGGGYYISEGAYSGTSSYYPKSTKNITINGGTIYAQGRGGAGIGGSHNGKGENITITGGNITADGYLQGAGDRNVGSGIGSGGSFKSKGIVIAPGVRTTITAKAGNVREFLWEAEYTEETDISGFVYGQEVFTITSVVAPCPHNGGEATCKDKAICGDCGEPYGEVDLENHVGDTELRGVLDAAEGVEGYTGDVHCLSCGERITQGEVIPALPKANSSGNQQEQDAAAMPQTGDRSSMLAWLALLGAASFAFAQLKRRTA